MFVLLRIPCYGEPVKDESIISDLDIYRCARLVLRQHGGEDAVMFAAQRADEMLARGNAEGASVWRRITRAIGVSAQEVIPTGVVTH